MKKAIVIFKVGTAHVLYNKEVEAFITHENTGYDRKQTHAKTVEPVFHPADPQGILSYDKDGKFTGYKERSAYSAHHEGYVEVVRYL